MVVGVVTVAVVVVLGSFVDVDVVCIVVVGSFVGVVVVVVVVLLFVVCVVVWCVQHHTPHEPSHQQGNFYYHNFFLHNFYYHNFYPPLLSFFFHVQDLGHKGGHLHVQTKERTRGQAA